MNKIHITLTASAALFAAITSGVIIADGKKEPVPSVLRFSSEPPIRGATEKVLEEILEEVETAGNSSSKNSGEEMNQTLIPKPDAIKSATKWLISRQQENGGWGPGHVPAGVAERTTVGNTCIALQALIRDGHSPTTGEYREEVSAALAYVLSEIENSDQESLFVTNIRDSQLQSKLGTYVDTFIAATALPEFKGKTSNKKEAIRLDEGVKKLLAKIEANQAEDGSWKNAGWAPTLAQGFAAKSVNRAAQLGWKVDESVRERAEEFGRKNFDADSGTFSSVGSAGVELYSNSSSLQQIQDSAITNRTLKPQLEVEFAEATTKEARDAAESKLKKFADVEENLVAAQDAVVKRLEDPSFVAGFGNNGGEEFLSYVNIGESLRDKGGEDWEKWNTKMSANMVRTQANDGCWKGQHCITGGTFCTSTGLLVLLMDKETPDQLVSSAE